MKSKSEYFIGITSWNSEAFLRPCLNQINKTTRGRARVVVLDNLSVDKSAEVASALGAEVIFRKCDQATALNALLDMSHSRYTLLMHADVIVLHDNWLELCTGELSSNVALLSPEDIGCGPYTRPWGKGMPESSFMFFDTDKAKSCREVFWKQRYKLKWPFKALDFFGPHITYHLPASLRSKGYNWRMMRVHPSVEDPEPVYIPPFSPKIWRQSFSKLRYGLGNFYSLRGKIIHYHNWYDRIGVSPDGIDRLSTETVPKGDGFPVAYIQICSANLLNDLRDGQLRLPELGADSP